MLYSSDRIKWTTQGVIQELHKLATDLEKAPFDLLQPCGHSIPSRYKVQNHCPSCFTPYSYKGPNVEITQLVRDVKNITTQKTMADKLLKAEALRDQIATCTGRTVPNPKLDFLLERISKVLMLLPLRPRSNITLNCNETLL